MANDKDKKKDYWVTVYKNARILFFVDIVFVLYFLWFGSANPQFQTFGYATAGGGVIAGILWFLVWRLFKNKSSYAIPVGYTFFTLFLLSSIAGIILNPGVGYGVGLAIAIYFLVITYKAQQSGSAVQQSSNVTSQ